MLTYLPHTQSYTFDKGYCHNKVNESNFLQNLVGELSRLNLTSVLEEKHSQTVSLPRIQRAFNKKTNKKDSFTIKKLSSFTNRTNTNPEFNDFENEKIEKSEVLVKKIK